MKFRGSASKGRMLAHWNGNHKILWHWPAQNQTLPWTQKTLTAAFKKKCLSNSICISGINYFRGAFTIDLLKLLSCAHDRKRACASLSFALAMTVEVSTGVPDRSTAVYNAWVGAKARGIANCKANQHALLRPRLH